MTKAFGGVQSVAEKANLNPTQLYRTLSQDGNPGLSSRAAILKAMGRSSVRLSIVIAWIICYLIRLIANRFDFERTSDGCNGT
jgi:hypothetical protein